GVAGATAHHVGEPEQKNDGDRANGDRNETMRQKVCHANLLRTHCLHVQSSFRGARSANPESAATKGEGQDTVSRAPGYGFRARGLKPAPGMTDVNSIHPANGARSPAPESRRRPRRC